MSSFIDYITNIDIPQIMTIMLARINALTTGGRIEIERSRVIGERVAMKKNARLIAPDIAVLLLSRAHTRITSKVNHDCIDRDGLGDIHHNSQQEEMDSLGNLDYIAADGNRINQRRCPET